MSDRAKSFWGILSVALSLLFIGNASADCVAPLIEQEGILVGEAESVELMGDWRMDFLTPGHTGLGYIFHTGGAGKLTYKLKINNPGIYRFQLRSKVGMGKVTTEHNDSYVSFPDASDFFAVALDNNDTLRNTTYKAYSSASLDWNWTTYTVDHDPHILFVKFDTAGVYTFNLEGRSAYHIVDRFVLYNTSFTELQATDPARKTNSCGILDTMNFVMCDFNLEPNGFLANTQAELNFTVTVAELTQDAVKEIMIDLTPIGLDPLFLNRVESGYRGSVSIDSMPTTSKEITAIALNHNGHGKTLTHFIALTHIVPGIVEGEKFSKTLGALTRDDTPLNDFVGWIDPGDWVAYYLEVPEAGTYTIILSVATMLNNVDISVSVNDVYLKDITFPTTGGWRIFDTFEMTLPLEAGKNLLKLTSNADAWNKSHIMIEKSEAVTFLEGVEIHKLLVDTLYTGDTLKLNPVFYPAHASFKKVEWVSSQPLVVKVSDDGTLVARKPGFSTISMTTYDGMIKDNFEVYVFDKESLLSQNKCNPAPLSVCPTVLSAGQNLNITFYNQHNSTVNFCFTDINGRLCQQFIYEHVAGTVTLTPELKSGLYILTIEAPEYIKRVKLLIE